MLNLLYNNVLKCLYGTTIDEYRFMRALTGSWFLCTLYQAWSIVQRIQTLDNLQGLYNSLIKCLFHLLHLVDSISG